MLRLPSVTRAPAWLAAGLLVAACGGGGAPSAAPELLAPAAAAAEPIATTTTNTPTSTTAPDAAPHRIVVDGARLAPSSLTLPAGASGVVMLENRDGVAYEAEIGTPEPFPLRLPAGGAAEVDFGEHLPGRYRVTIRIGNGSATVTVDTTALDAGDLLCSAAATVEPAGRELATAADRAAAKLTGADPAGFFAEFRALGKSDLPRLARAAAELEDAWRAVAAALPAPAADDAAAVAGWLATLAAQVGPARWPAQVAGPWQAGADEAASRATAAAAVVDAECGVELPVPPGLPSGAPVALLAALAGPPGFVAPPLEVTAASYDVEQSSLPHATYVHQRTEFEAPDRVRAEVEWTVNSEQRAVEEVVVVGGQVHARWAGQGWRDVRFEEETSLAPFRADRTIPFGALLDALYAGANDVPPREGDVRGSPALGFDLEVDQELEDAILGRLVPWGSRTDSRVGGAELWVDPDTLLPRRAALSLFTPVYPDGLDLTWEFRSFGEPAGPIALPPQGDPAPAGFTVFRDRHGGWQAPVSNHWVPVEPVEPGSAGFITPSATVEVFPGVYGWEGALAGYEALLVDLFGEPVARDHTTTQLGPLPAERLELIFDGPAGAERWTVVRGDDGEHAYWVVVIAFESDPYLDAEVDEMLAGFELIGTAT